MGTAGAMPLSCEDEAAVAVDLVSDVAAGECVLSASMTDFGGRYAITATIAIALVTTRPRIGSCRLGVEFGGGRSIARERSRVAMFASALIAISSWLRRQHRRTKQPVRPGSRFRTSRIAIWIA